ncbi:unnamed protein product [Protopolystoma xenopodis]|uniref:Uncharacterized protein n=1 Tax=Protopolystoma xenopodis TaxID=117903 RepID=A0A448XJR0_9PLAT|nr:unnamed protein product [Protopolystoma xenopodis]
MPVAVAMATGRSRRQPVPVVPPGRRAEWGGSVSKPGSPRPASTSSASLGCPTASASRLAPDLSCRIARVPGLGDASVGQPAGPLSTWAAPGPRGRRGGGGGGGGGGVVRSRPASGRPETGSAGGAGGADAGAAVAGTGAGCWTSR